MKRKRYVKRGLYRLQAITGEFAEQWPAIARYGDTLCKIVGKGRERGEVMVRVGSEEAYLPAELVGELVGLDYPLGPAARVVLQELAKREGARSSFLPALQAAGHSTDSSSVSSILQRLGDWKLPPCRQVAWTKGIKTKRQVLHLRKQQDRGSKTGRGLITRKPSGVATYHREPSTYNPGETIQSKSRIIPGKRTNEFRQYLRFTYSITPEGLAALADS